MMTYVTAFIFYTLAMIGILLVGFVVYKKTFIIDKGENKGTIKILDSLPIGNKKTLLVVKIKNEKFLIASGAEHTTFLSKLENETPISKIKEEIITPEVVDMSLVEKIHNENFSEQLQQARFDDVQKTRAAEIQRQFKELYEKEDIPTPQVVDETTKRKEMLKHLLKEFHKDGNRI